MSGENLAPRDAKVISVILRSLGIEECEPKVISQLLEFGYKYTTDVIEDAILYARYAERENVTVKDMKLALQMKVGKYFLPAPPRTFLQASAEITNSKPLTLPDPENLLRVPHTGNGLYGVEYTVEQKEMNLKRRKIH
ncbi:transcription initiation factor TFIID subunit 9 [Pancytospora epiphaga]|nr:transcription initiation factor TFIID subunit 9 [Pancytospora epiphaga]